MATKDAGPANGQPDARIRSRELGHGRYMCAGASGLVVSLCRLKKASNSLALDLSQLAAGGHFHSQALSIVETLRV